MRINWRPVSIGDLFDQSKIMSLDRRPKSGSAGVASLPIKLTGARCQYARRSLNHGFSTLRKAFFCTVRVVRDEMLKLCARLIGSLQGCYLLDNQKLERIKQNSRRFFERFSFYRFLHLPPLLDLVGPSKARFSWPNRVGFKLKGIGQNKPFTTG